MSAYTRSLDSVYAIASTASDAINVFFMFFYLYLGISYFGEIIGENGG